MEHAIATVAVAAEYARSGDQLGEELRRLAILGADRGESFEQRHPLRPVGYADAVLPGAVIERRPRRQRHREQSHRHNEHRDLCQARRQPPARRCAGGRGAGIAARQVGGLAQPGQHRRHFLV